MEEQQQQQQQQQEEIEVNFRLDGEGRTALSSSSSTSGEDAEAAVPGPQLDYSTKAIRTQFVPIGNGTKTNASSSGGASRSASGDESNVDDDNVDDDEAMMLEALHDELLLDCEIADSGLMPRTFWVPAANDDFEPRCQLERMARDIFQHHAANTSSCYDPAASGAEWWVQLRPSPEKTGRYSMHAQHRGDDKDNQDDERTGITFHWDKDEDLRILCGGTTYVHPHLSTVTYLTDLGAPTLVAEGFRIHNLTGEWLPPPPNDDDAAAAVISWPSRGKHLSFDGRFLHAAPSDLQEPGAFAEQCEIPKTTNTDIDERKQKALLRRHRRCTFLVNVWLNYKPFNVHPFPETMIDKMSGYQQHPVSTESESDNTSNKAKSKRWRLSFLGDNSAAATASTAIVTAIVGSDRAVKVFNDNGTPKDDDLGAQQTTTQQFTWPMGDADSREIIRATLPLSLIRAQAKGGGNVRIMWTNGNGPKNGDDLTTLSNDGRGGMYLIKEDLDSKKDDATGAPSKRPRLGSTEKS